MKQLRDNILLYLKESREGFVSGEAISNFLGISRAGVWKHIQYLRKKGFIIEASPRLGYRLLAEPNLLNLDEIKRGFEEHSFFKNLIYYPSLDSSNREANRLAEKGAPEGTVILAEEQTHGTGRRGRVWFSPQGKGLWLSVIFRPQDTPPENISPLTAVSAAVIASILRNITGEPISVKWPNDIFLNGRKIGGILAELKTEPERVHYIILGIGLNINHTIDDFPEELTKIATSLRIEGNKHIDRHDICRALLVKLESGYNVFLKEGFAPFRSIWKKNNITLGKQVSISYGDKIIKGLALDIDDDGALIIEDANKQIHRFTYGEIER